MCIKLIWCFQKSYDIINATWNDQSTFIIWYWNLCPWFFHFLERVPYQLLWPEAPIYYKEKTMARRCYIDEVGGCYIEKTFPSLPRHLAEERGNCSTRQKRRMLYFLADLIVLSIVGALLSCFVCLIYRWLRKNGTCIFMQCTLSGGGIYSISADQDISQGPTHVIVYL